MKSKDHRQACIIQIMKNGHFHTQQEVASELKQNGFYVTQSTLSKDFKDLKLVKTIATDGTFKYVLPQLHSLQKDTSQQEIKNYVNEVDFAANMVILKTSAGRASGTCESIDQSGWPELIGSIAGENTILLICKTPTEAKRLMRRVQAIIGS